MTHKKTPITAASLTVIIVLVLLADSASGQGGPVIQNQLGHRQSVVSWNKMQLNHALAEEAMTDPFRMNEALRHIRATRAAHARTTDSVLSHNGQQTLEQSLLNGLGIFAEAERNFQLLDGPFAAMEGRILHRLGRYQDAERELLVAESCLRASLTYAEGIAQLKSKLWQILIATQIERSQVYCSSSRRKKGLELLVDTEQLAEKILAELNEQGVPHSDDWNQSLWVLYLELGEEYADSCFFQLAEKALTTARRFCGKRGDASWDVEADSQITAAHIEILASQGKYSEAAHTLHEYEQAAGKDADQSIAEMLHEHLTSTHQVATIPRSIDPEKRQTGSLHLTSARKETNDGERQTDAARTSVDVGTRSSIGNADALTVETGNHEQAIEKQRSIVHNLAAEGQREARRAETLALAQLLSMTDVDGPNYKQHRDESIRLVDQILSSNTAVVAKTELLESDVRELMASGLVQSRAGNHMRAHELLQIGSASVRGIKGPTPTGLLKLTAEVNVVCVDVWIRAVIESEQDRNDQKQFDQPYVTNALNDAKAAISSLARVTGAEIPIELQLRLAFAEAAHAVATGNRSIARQALRASMEHLGRDCHACAPFISTGESMAKTKRVVELSQLILSMSTSFELNDLEASRFCRAGRNIGQMVVAASLGQLKGDWHRIEDDFPQLAADSAMIEFFSDGKKVVAFVSSNHEGAIRVSRVNLPNRNVVSQLSHQWHEALLAGQIRKGRRSTIQQQVFDEIWHPLEIEFGAVKKIYFICGGYLEDLPWHAMQDENGDFLAERYQFSVLTGPSTFPFAAAKPDSPPQPGTSLYITGEPDYGPSGSGDPFLPAFDDEKLVTALKEHEAGTIEWVHGSDVTAGKLSELIENATASIWLCVTHGIWDFDATKQPFELFHGEMVMAGANLKSNRNSLTAASLARARLPHLRLAVLCICWGGTGISIEGVGRFSFLEALQYSGCRTVITTHWQIQGSSANRFLMLVFRHFLREGHTIGRSVQLAQLDFIEEGLGCDCDPITWAPFVVGGDLDLKAENCGAWNRNRSSLTKSPSLIP